MGDRIRIVFVINSLGKGGAENALFKIVKRMDQERFHPVIVSILTPDYYYDLLSGEGFEVHSLYEGKSVSGFINMIKKLKHICKDADILQGWMYHSNLLVWIVGKLIKAPKIMFNIRHSATDWRSNRILTGVIMRICALMSYSIEKTVFVAESSLKSHLSIGYNAKNAEVIPNGIDACALNVHDDIKEKRVSRTRKSIVTLSRWHENKDIPNVIQAIKLLEDDKIKLTLCGNGLTSKNDDLNRLVLEYKLGDQVDMLGFQTNISQILSQADLMVLPSATEGFPNVVIEAMASGLPCIATDVGDCKSVLADERFIVPPQNAKALANAIGSYFTLDDASVEDVIESNRLRVVRKYSIERIVEKYENLYDSCYNK